MGMEEVVCIQDMWQCGMPEEAAIEISKGRKAGVEYEAFRLSPNAAALVKREIEVAINNRQN